MKRRAIIYRRGKAKGIQMIQIKELSQQNSNKEQIYYRKKAVTPLHKGPVGNLLLAESLGALS